jgi:hypothetical protein
MLFKAIQTNLSLYGAQQRLMTRQAWRCFSVPKLPNHKELFAEDYYDSEQLKNPFAQDDMQGDDFETWDKGAHRSTSQGILSNYKKQLNLNADDIIQKDYWDAHAKLHEDTARQIRQSRPERFTEEFT